MWPNDPNKQEDTNTRHMLYERGSLVQLTLRPKPQAGKHFVELRRQLEMVALANNPIW